MYFAESSSPPNNKVQAKAVVMDFSSLEDAEKWRAFAAALEGLDIGVLGKSHLTYFVHPSSFLMTNASQ